MSWEKESERHSEVAKSAADFRRKLLFENVSRNERISGQMAKTAKEMEDLFIVQKDSPDSALYKNFTLNKTILGKITIQNHEYAGEFNTYREARRYIDEQLCKSYQECD